jgi:mRNA interferase RelE/StbE
MEVRFAKTALKAILRSNKSKLLRDKIDQLANDPKSWSSNVTRLQGRTEFRLRVQDWRIIFRIEDGILWIDDVGPRGSIYED